jgi:hypothetical protein
MYAAIKFLPPQYNEELFQCCGNGEDFFRFMLTETFLVSIGAEKFRKDMFLPKLFQPLTAPAVARRTRFGKILCEKTDL